MKPVTSSHFLRLVIGEQDSRDFCGEKFSAALERELTENQSDVTVLRFQDDFSIREVVEVIGKRANAVKALQNHRINKLRQAISRENGGNDNG